MPIRVAALACDLCNLHYRTTCTLRPNSWMKSRQKSSEFSSLLFTVTSSALPKDFYFFKLTQPLTVSTVQLLYIEKERKGVNLVENHTHPLWFKKFVQWPKVRELSRLCPETSTNLYIHESASVVPTPVKIREKRVIASIIVNYY